MTIVSGFVARSEADNYGHVFQGNNNPFLPVLIGGDVFFGIQAYVWSKFAGLGIPKGAQILNADINMRSVDNRGSAGFTFLVNTISDGAWKPNSFGPAWRSGIWDTIKMELVDTGTVSLIDTVPAVPTTFRYLRAQSNPDRHVRIGQLITPTTSGNIGSIIVHAAKILDPTGDITLTIVGGSDIDGPVLATSDPVAASVFPFFTRGPVTFPFSGAEQIALSSGTSYHIIIDGTYPLGVSARYLTFTYLTQFFGIGGGRYYGIGQDFDNQLYPGNADGFVQSQQTLGVDIPWLTGAWTTGSTFTTVDLSQIIQAAVDDSAYSDGDAIGVSFSTPVGQGGQRRIAAFSHSTLAPMELTVEYLLPVGTAPNIRRFVRSHHLHPSQLRAHYSRATIHHILERANICLLAVFDKRFGLAALFAKRFDRPAVFDKGLDKPAAYQPSFVLDAVFDKRLELPAVGAPLPVSTIYLAAVFDKRFTKTATFDKRLVRPATFNKTLAMPAVSQKQLSRPAVFSKRLVKEGVYSEC